MRSPLTRVLVSILAATTVAPLLFACSKGEENEPTEKSAEAPEAPAEGEPEASPEPVVDEPEPEPESEPEPEPESAPAAPASLAGLTWDADVVTDHAFDEASQTWTLWRDARTEDAAPTWVVRPWDDTLEPSLELAAKALAEGPLFDGIELAEGNGWWVVDGVEVAPGDDGTRSGWYVLGTTEASARLMHRGPVLHAYVAELDALCAVRISPTPTSTVEAGILEALSVCFGQTAEAFRGEAFDATLGAWSAKDAADAMAAKRAMDRAIAENAGLLGALSDSGAMEGAFGSGADFEIDHTAVWGEIDSGLVGGVGTPIGSGGLGVGGGGEGGGGGAGFGTIGALGNSTPEPSDRKAGAGVRHDDDDDAEASE